MCQVPNLSLPLAPDKYCYNGLEMYQAFTHVANERIHSQAHMHMASLLVFC